MRGSFLSAVIGAAVVFTLILEGTVVHADDAFVDFTDAKNAYEAGEYETAVARFEKILESEPGNEALLIEIHKFLAVCYLFVEDRDNAEKQFVKLLVISPDFSLDPLVFPIDVVDFFTNVKRNHAERLEEIARAKAAAEEERKRHEEEQRRLELERLTRNVYVQKTVDNKSLLVAFMPFGAGQFQNGHKTKGILFLSGELFFGTAAVVTYALHASLRDEASSPIYSTSQREEYERFEKGYRIANHVSLISLGVMMVVGLVDSLYYYKAKTISYTTIDEKDVPERFHPKPGTPVSKGMISPILGDGMVGIGALGTF